MHLAIRGLRIISGIVSIGIMGISLVFFGICFSGEPPMFPKRDPWETISFKHLNIYETSAAFFPLAICFLFYGLIFLFLAFPWRAKRAWVATIVALGILGVLMMGVSFHGTPELP